MKKQFFVYLFAALTLGGVVTSCSDDDDDLTPKPEKPEVKPEEKPEEKPVVNPISQKTTYAGKTLVLNYSGVSMIGKQVVFTPDAANANKATIVLSGEEAEATKAEGLSLSNGVIPGEASTTINLDLVIDGENVTFKGESAENGKTISYEGSANKDKMTLNLNVAMPANSLQGKNITLFTDGKDKLLPMNIIWTVMAEDSWTHEIVEQDASFFIKMALAMVKIDGLTLSQSLCAVLNQVSFLADGNIQAQYKDTPQSSELKTSPLNLATYTSSKEGEIRLFLNVQQIMQEATKEKTKAADEKEASVEDLLPYVAEVLPQLMAMVPQLLTEGILINYEVDENGVMFVYLDKEVLLPILKVFSPMLQNKDFLKIVGEIADAKMPTLGQTVTALLEGFPKLFDTTEKMQIGVKFVDAK